MRVRNRYFPETTPGHISIPLNLDGSMILVRNVERFAFCRHIVL